MKKKILCLLFILNCNFLQARPLYYFEEFLDMFYVPSYPNKENFERNIYWLKRTLERPFKPAETINFKTQNKREYEKYQYLQYFYAYFLICHSYLRLAGEYDKHKIVWTDKRYEKEINASLDLAVDYYDDMDRYWDMVLQYVQKLEDYKDVSLEGYHFIEELLFKVQTRVIDYHYISLREKNNVRVERERLTNLLLQ